MNTLDFILLVPLVFGAYNGFKKGFILEVISIIAFILAIIGSFTLLQWGMDLLSENFNINSQLLPYISFVLIFIGIIFIVNLLGKVAKKLVELVLLGPVDKMAGAIVSLIKWSFGVSIIIWLTDSFGIGLFDSWKEDSVLYPYFLSFAPLVVDLFSQLLPFARDLFDSIKDLLKGAPTA